MIVRLFCYILAASFVLIDGSIGFGAILITVLIVSVLILIALNLG